MEPMNKLQAYKYLAETVAEYLINEFPISYLTGDDGRGNPDEGHLAKLKEALRIVGKGHAVEFANIA